MNCNQAEKMITVSIDGELEPEMEGQLAGHLESCPRCQEIYAQEQNFKLIIRDRLNRVTAPVHLKSQIRTAIRTMHMPVTWRQQVGYFLDRYARQAAGTLAAMLLLTLSLFYWQYDQPHNSSDHPPVLIVELVKHHANCAMEITTSQPDEIRGWLKQRGIALTINTPPLNASDYRLLGAHLCQMLHKDAAYLVYTHNEKEVSICCIDGGDIDLDVLDRITFGTGQYYTITYEDRNLVLWQDGGTIYSLVGQATQDDLLAMAAVTRGI